jgi:uncharacterized lipoprotein NlpE involved in copper resistance
MDRRNFYIGLAINALVLAALACGFNVSTAKIASATLAADKSGTPVTTTFSQDQSMIYLIVELANAPDDTKVKAVWTAVQAEGVDANYLLDQSELTSGSGTLTFTLTNNQLWPTGKYKADLYLNDKLDRTLEYEVR